MQLIKYISSLILSVSYRVLIIWLLLCTQSWSSVIGDEYQIDLNGILSGGFPGGFTQENFITQFELGNGGEGTPNTPVIFGTPHLVPGWLRGSQAAMFTDPQSILVQDSLSTSTVNTSSLFFDIAGVETNANQVNRQIFTNNLQQNSSNTIGNVGIDIVGVSIGESLTGDLSLSAPILTLFYDDDSSLDISNDSRTEIVTFLIDPISGDFTFSADIDPSLFQTNTGLNVTRLTLETTVTSVPLPAGIWFLLSGLALLFAKQQNYNNRKIWVKRSKLS